MGTYSDSQLIALATSNSIENRWIAIFYNNSQNFVVDVPGSLNNWTHFCLGYNGTHGIAYVNGTLAGSGEFAHYLGNDYPFEAGNISLSHNDIHYFLYNYFQFYRSTPKYELFAHHVTA